MIEYVQFFPTLRCNRNCEFCFSKGLFYNDFPEEKIGKFIAILKENQINSLDILGGEPFLYKSLNKLAQKAIENEIEVTISTNGTLINELKIFLKKFGNKRVKVGISINEPPANDLLEIIKVNKLWIKSVINEEILPQKNLIEFAKACGIKYYLIYMDALKKEDLEISMAFHEFMNKIKEYRKLFPQIEPVFCKGFIGGNSTYRCPAGIEKITIMPDGSVYPCYLLGRFKEYKIGNVFEDSLLEILSSPKLEIFKTYDGNICNNKICIYYEKCRGGCVAHSIIHYGTHRKPDPRCTIKKEESYDTSFKNRRRDKNGRDVKS